MSTKCWTVCLAFVLFASIACAKETKRPRIVGVSHIAFFAHDMDKSLAFYKEFLGFDEPFRLDRPDGGLICTFIKINDRQCIELFPEREAGTDRLYQVAFEIDDAEAMRTYLASCGIQVPEKVVKGRIGNMNFSIKDPDGHTVEFVQYLPDGRTLQDAGKHMPGSRISSHIKHAGFTVRHLDRSLAFYGGILGFRETWRGANNDTMLQWVNLKLPDGDDYIELMLYRDPPSLPRLGTMNHLSLEVPEVPKAAALLESRPERKSYARTLEVRTGTNRKRQMNLYDPDGSRSELMEPGTVDGVPAPSSKAPPPK